MPTIQLWGNSVELQFEGDRLVIARSHAQRTPLADLFARCRPDSRPEAVDFGQRPAGKSSERGA